MSITRSDLSNRKQARPQSSSELEELWTVDQIAAHYKVCTKTVRRKLKELDVPFVRIGQKIRVPESHVPLLAKKSW
jgi:excisionase family DNA binding protein